MFNLLRLKINSRCALKHPVLALKPLCALKPLIYSQFKQKFQKTCFKLIGNQGYMPLSAFATLAPSALHLCTSQPNSWLSIQTFTNQPMFPNFVVEYVNSRKTKNWQIILTRSFLNHFILHIIHRIVITFNHIF